MKKLLIVLATTVALVGPAHAHDADGGYGPKGGCLTEQGRGPCPPKFPKSMTGTWCFDRELTNQDGEYEVYLRTLCTDGDAIVVRTDGYVASSRRCKFDEVTWSGNHGEYWVYGHCVESSELGVPGRRVLMGQHGGLIFKQVNNLQLKITETPPR
jgi:hypothetical protein